MDAALSEEAEAYLRDKRVHYLFNEMAAELVEKRPDDPLAFLAGRLPQLQRVLLAPKAMQEDRADSRLGGRALTVVVFGATGELARRTVFPALYQLYAQGLLPERTSFVAYGRTQLGRADYERRLEPHLPRAWHDTVRRRFCANLSYVQGQYDDPTLRCFKGLDHDLTELEAARGGPAANRLFYLAIPPELVMAACSGIRGGAASPSGWTRVVLERPLGSNADTAARVHAAVGACFDEAQVVRIDHRLGRQTVDSVLAARFANRLLAQVWDAASVLAVHVSFWRRAGPQLRGGYFDRAGVVRDVLHGHLLRVMALLAMEKPRSLGAEHVRDEMALALRRVGHAAPETTVLGQYGPSRDGRLPGYLDDPLVPAGSRCATFAQTTLRVNNDRWAGVPWMLEAGFGMPEDEVVIRVQFRPEILPFGDGAVGRNELLIRTYPEEAVYLRMNVKEQGTLTRDVRLTELELTGPSRYYSPTEPDLYEGLVLAALCGDLTYFPRRDELEAGWQVFQPLLEQMDAEGAAPPSSYPFGTPGPPAARKAREALFQAPVPG